MSGRERGGLPPWAVYTGLRLLLFLVPLAVVYALSRNLVLAGAIAAVLSFCISLVVLDRPRNDTAAALQRRLERRRSKGDEAVEDAAVDGQNASAAASPKP